MLSAALYLVVKYGTTTFPQADELWALYDSGSGIHLSWLWKPWAEHRIPLAKLLWKGVLQLTDYNFRSGNFFTVFALAGVAFAMLRVAKRVRGRTIVADAFFPLAILNFGQAQVFLWWWQVNHILAPLTACMILLLIVLYEDTTGVGTAILMGAGLVLLGVCGPGGMPYILVLGVWLSIWIGSRWSGFTKRQRGYVLFVMVLIGISLGLVCVYFVNYTPYFPQNNPASVSPWPSPPSFFTSVVTGFQILGLSLGTATKPYALYWGVSVFLLLLSTAVVLVRSWLATPKLLSRSLGLFLFIGGPAALLIVISQSRAGMGLEYIYSGHYLTHMLPMLCSVYFIWEFSGKTYGRNVQYLMFIVLVLLLPYNFRRGPEVGKYIQHRTVAFERDINNEVPLSVLAERHFCNDLLPCPYKIERILKFFKKNGIGFFVQMRDDPDYRVVKFPVKPETVTEIIWKNGVACRTDYNKSKSALTFVFPEAQYIYAIRLHYVYIKADNLWPTLRIFWGHNCRKDFTNRDPGEVKQKLFLTTPGPDQSGWALIDGKIKIDATGQTERTLTVWVDKKIDQFLISPDFGNFEFRLSGIELLVPR